MAPSPTVATDRLVFRYSITGVHHRQTCYFLAQANPADPSGQDAVLRGGAGVRGVSTLCDPFFNAIKASFTPATSFDGMTLEQSLAGSWIPVYTQPTLVVGTAAGGDETANGVDIVGKDLAHRTIHAYLYEGVFGFANKFTSYAAMSATQKALVDYYFNVGGAAPFDSAWFWRRAKTSSYAQSWLSYVIDTNEKLRRIRGIK